MTHSVVASNTTLIKETIAKNSFWLFFGKLVSKCFSFAFIVYTTRTIGAGAFGSFSFALAFLGVIFLFSDSGLASLFVREYNKDAVEKRNLYANVFYLKIFLVIASALIAFFLIPTVADLGARGILLILIGVYICNTLREYFLSIARAVNHMHVEAGVLIVESAVTALVGGVLLYFSPSLQSVALAYTVGAICSFFVSLLGVFSHLSHEYSFVLPKWNFDRQLIFDVLPFSFGAFATTVLLSTDLIFLGWLENSETVGQYSIGVRMVNFLTLIPILLGSAALPTITKLTVEPARVRRLVQYFFSVMLMVIVPLIIGGILVSHNFIVTVFGEEYQKGVLSFQILLGSMLMFFPILFLEPVFFAFNQQVKKFQFTAIAAVVNLILNMILIPPLSLYGSAAALMVAQTIHLYLTYRYAAEILQGPPLMFRELILPTIAATTMGVALIFFQILAAPLAALVLLGIAYYSIFIYLFDRTMFNRVISLFTIIRFKNG